MTIAVAVQASPRDRASWLDLAAEVERAGFDALYACDHPGTSPAPFVALASAASATERIRLGTCVLNAGVWEPIPLANAVATLDVVSGGRAVLGVGAGHTPQEWTATGRSFPSPGARVDRMVELIEVTQALLGGQPVSHRGPQFALTHAVLAAPRVVQDRVPLLVGGNGARVLRFAAQRADVVGLTGLGRTLADGHHHEVDWSASGVERIVETVRKAAHEGGRRPQLEALVQHVEITDDAAAVAARLATHVPGATVDDLLDSPFMWIGTVDEITSKLDDHQARLGLDRYVVREPAVPFVREILGSSGS